MQLVHGALRASLTVVGLVLGCAPVSPAPEPGAAPAAPDAAIWVYGADRWTPEERDAQLARFATVARRLYLSIEDGARLLVDDPDGVRLGEFLDRATGRFGLAVEAMLLQDPGWAGDPAGGLSVSGASSRSTPPGGRGACPGSRGSTSTSSPTPRKPGSAHPRPSGPRRSGACRRCSAGRGRPCTRALRRRRPRSAPPCPGGSGTSRSRCPARRPPSGSSPWTRSSSWSTGIRGGRWWASRPPPSSAASTTHASGTTCRQVAASASAWRPSSTRTWRAPGHHRGGRGRPRREAGLSRGRDLRERPGVRRPPRRVRRGPRGRHERESGGRSAPPGRWPRGRDEPVRRVRVQGPPARRRRARDHRARLRPGSDRAGTARPRPRPGAFPRPARAGPVTGPALGSARGAGLAALLLLTLGLVAARPGAAQIRLARRGARPHARRSAGRGGHRVHESARGPPPGSGGSQGARPGPRMAPPSRRGHGGLRSGPRGDAA